MNSLCVKAKLQNGQFKSSKLIFCKFKGQFEVKVTSFEINRDLKMINTHLKFEAEIPNGSKAVAFTRNYTKFLSLMSNLTLS